jgi:hypothetical protein
MAGQALLHLSEDWSRSLFGLKEARKGEANRGGT